MSARTKKRPTKKKDNVLYVNDDGDLYEIPKRVAKRYLVRPKDFIPAEEVFAELDARYTKPGVMLQGVRAREGLTQAEFAEMIGVTQSNLSSMENGRRPIGKKIAKRIEAMFDVHFSYFLDLE